MIFLVFHPVRLFTFLVGMFLPALFSFPGLHLTGSQVVVLLILFAWMVFVPAIDAVLDEVQHPGADVALLLMWGGL